MPYSVLKVMEKREFSQLPTSIVERALEISKGDVKMARSFLRKYFGVFLTNKVLKGKTEKTLNSHISSKLRNYREFYGAIFEKDKSFKSVVDLGCGVNGFSYNFLTEVFGEIDYVGVEASGQIVENANYFFEKTNLKNCKLIHRDLFDLESVKKILRDSNSPKVVFLFQVLDALEAIEKNFSKKLLLEIFSVLDEKDLVVISMPLKSISGRKKFEAERTWLLNFLEEHFSLEKDFEIGNERVFLIRK
jgi:hypothetical protein